MIRIDVIALDGRKRAYHQNLTFGDESDAMRVYRALLAAKNDKADMSLTTARGDMVYFNNILQVGIARLNGQD